MTDRLHTRRDHRHSRRRPAWPDAVGRGRAAGLPHPYLRARARTRPPPTWPMRHDRAPMTMRRRWPPSPRRSTSSPTNSRMSPPPRSTCWTRPRPIRPNRRALAIAQDRIAEKDFLTSHRPDHRTLCRGRRRCRPRGGASPGSALPAILKTTRLGYDGKGQARIMARRRRGRGAGRPCRRAGRAGRLRRLQRRGLVIAARGARRRGRGYDPGENVHRDGILHTTTVPARLTPGQRSDAILLAARILNALDYVGVIGVELFVTPRRA